MTLTDEQIAEIAKRCGFDAYRNGVGTCTIQAPDDGDDLTTQVLAIARAAADAALAGAREPVGYVNGRALEWLHNPDRGTIAHIQVGIFKTPGEECATPIYAAAPPAPDAQPAEPVAPELRKDWDWKHPSAQFYIGQNARKSIYLQLAEQIVDGDDDAYSDEYWLPLHDKLTTAMRRLRELEALAAAHEAEAVVRRA